MNHPARDHGTAPAGTANETDSGAVVWLTGLSGSGKSTIGQALRDRLIALGCRVEYLDGDALRDAFPNTGFSRAERDAHVARVGFLASRLEFHRVFVVCALISPYADSRNDVRARCRRFIEVHVSTSLEECERRDVKGLYARARRGELTQFTGIDDPYEPPAAPEIAVDTATVPVEAAVDRIVHCLGFGTAG
jgi:adenylylsulfate kinase